MAKKREMGYYWVMTFGCWYAAYWDIVHERWQVIIPAYIQTTFPDDAFVEIDENRIPNPSERKKIG